MCVRERDVFFTIKKWLKVGNHKTLSGDTAARRAVGGCRSGAVHSGLEVWDKDGDLECFCVRVCVCACVCVSLITASATAPCALLLSLSLSRALSLSSIRPLEIILHLSRCFLHYMYKFIEI